MLGCKALGPDPGHVCGRVVGRDYARETLTGCDTAANPQSADREVVQQNNDTFEPSNEAGSA